MKVNFLIGGTQKGGTTTLDAYLRSHPSVLMSKQKEVHFFDNESHFCSGIVDYSIYHSNFEPNQNGMLIGEATPIYMYWLPAPKRVLDYNPDMKWILVLRNPIERAYSHWNMERNRGAESLSFLDAVTYEKERSTENLPEQHRVYSYIDRGFYTTQIRRIWQYFPIEQTLFLKSETLRDNPSDAACKIFEFLGIKNNMVSHQNLHIGNYFSKLTDAERTHLKKLFKDEILELENLLGWNCADWLE